MKIALNTDELGELVAPVHGGGRMQDLIRKLQRQYDHKSGVVTVDSDDLAKIPEFAASREGDQGCQRRLRTIFRRSLGENLDRS
jgi:hypothetical protein